MGVQTPYLTTMSQPRITVLEEKHMISTLLYLREHPGCNKSDLYMAVSRNPACPKSWRRSNPSVS